MISLTLWAGSVSLLCLVALAETSRMKWIIIYFAKKPWYGVFSWGVWLDSGPLPSLSLCEWTDEVPVHHSCVNWLVRSLSTACSGPSHPGVGHLSVILSLLSTWSPRKLGCFLKPFLLVISLKAFVLEEYIQNHLNIPESSQMETCTVSLCC